MKTETKTFIEWIRFIRYGSLLDKLKNTKNGDILNYIIHD